VSETVTVSRSIAKVTVNVYNEAGEIVRHLYAWADDPGNNSLTDVSLSTVLLNPSASNGTNELTITSASGLTVIWDGKSDNGAIVTNGHYQIEIHYSDGKGSDQTISKGVVVETTNNPISQGVLTAGPNVLRNGETVTTIRVNLSTPCTLVVRLYDVAGELLRTVEGPAGSNQVTLNVKGLSSGLYFLIVDLRNPNGGSAGKKVARILIQK